MQSLGAPRLRGRFLAPPCTGSTFQASTRHACALAQFTKVQASGPRSLCFCSDTAPVFLTVLDNKTDICSLSQQADRRHRKRTRLVKSTAATSVAHDTRVGQAEGHGASSSDRQQMDEGTAQPSFNWLKQWCASHLVLASSADTGCIVWESTLAECLCNMPRQESGEA